MFKRQSQIDAERKRLERLLSNVKGNSQKAKDLRASIQKDLDLILKGGKV